MDEQRFIEIEGQILVWSRPPNEPQDSALCLIEHHIGPYHVASYNDVQKVFAIGNGHFEYLSNIKRWAQLDS